MYSLFVMFLLMSTFFTIEITKKTQGHFNSNNLYEYGTLDHDNHQMLIKTKDDLLHYKSLTLTSIKFYLYLPQEENSTLEITPENVHLLDTSKPTKMIIHGLTGFHNQLWIDQMVTRYHSKGDFNVIAVDWSQTTVTDTFYLASAIDSVGNVVATFLIDISKTNVGFLRKVHLIGSSMGAQIGAVAGENIMKSGKGKIDRITGLNPHEQQDLRLLDKDDAIFVDVIHTSFRAEDKGVGTVDFFVTDDEDFDKNCSCVCSDEDGLSAEDIFISTIADRNKFEAVYCQNVTSYMENLCRNNTKVTVGEWVPRNVSGRFFLTTDDAPSLLPQQLNMLIISCLTLVFAHVMLY